MPPDADLAFARAAVSEVLSRGGKDASQPWENPRSGARGTVTPIASAYTQDGQTCRDFLASYVQRQFASLAAGRSLQAAEGRLGSARAQALEARLRQRRPLNRVASGPREPHIERSEFAGITSRRVSGIFHGDCTDARPLRDSGGFQGCGRGRDQERLSAASPRSCIPTPTSTIRRRPRASPSSTPPTRSSATTTSARRSTAARSTPRASRASTASKAAQPGGGFGPGASHFESFTFGPDGFQRRGGGGGARRHARRLRGHPARTCSAARRAAVARLGTQFEPEDFGAPSAGQDLHATLTITLPEAAKGTKTPRSSADRQGRRGQDSGRARRRPADPAQGPGLAECDRQGRRCADHRQRRAASAVQAGRRRPAARSADHALRSGARRQGAGADARRRGRIGDSRRHQFRPHLPPQGQGPQGQEAKSGTGDLLATVRIVLPERADDELEELMRKWRDKKPYDPRKDLGVSAFVRSDFRSCAAGVLSTCS